MKNLNGIQIVSLDAQTATVRMRAPLAAAAIVAADGLEQRLAEVAAASQWNPNAAGKRDNFNYRSAGDILPKAEDYITVNFRAISKTVVPGHWIDWSKANVLKESTPKLKGQTVYPNHDFFDINNWIGAVSDVEWDEKGEQAEGVPGINATYKIDALMNPRIARGLLMKPPAIHSTSMTVLFKFEYSHPEIAAENRWRFFELLGEEVEGEIVRLVVTEILEYWEASLVFQGADRLAKKQSDEEEDLAGMSAKQPAAQPPANSNEEKTMKLTAEKKAELGIEFDGDDVPETEILKAAESLSAKVKEFDQVKFDELEKRAKAGDELVEKQRAEVTRLAKLAELGAEDGDLDEVVSQSIADADAGRLVKLEGYYKKKAAERFPKEGRSSQEGSQAVEAAGGANREAKPVPVVGLHG
ncbi:MAG: hypothetical protein AB7Q00_15915 [Phycisphaerales bacterium]